MSFALLFGQHCTCTPMHVGSATCAAEGHIQKSNGKALVGVLASDKFTSIEQPQGAKVGSWPPTYIGSSQAIVLCSPNPLKFSNPMLDIRPSLEIITPRRGIAFWTIPFCLPFSVTLDSVPEFVGQVRPVVEFYIAPTLA